MDHQLPVVWSPARFKVLVCGRRWGKTTSGLIMCIEGHGPEIARGSHPYLPRATRLRPGAAEGAKVWWVQPNYPLAVEVWEDLKRATRGAWIGKREDLRRIILPGGGSITVRSADDPETLVATGLDGVVLDEAAKMSKIAWGQSLRPTLADRQGWAAFLSTPKGANWFKNLFDRVPTRQARDESWERWQRSTRDNPRISDAEIAEMVADEDMGPLTYAQEIEAQFVTAGEGMFKPEWERFYRVETDPILGLQYVLEHRNPEGEVYSRKWEAGNLWRFVTVDPAFTKKQTSDYTCICCWGVTPPDPKPHLLLLDAIRRRMRGPDVVPAMELMDEKWEPVRHVTESTGAQVIISQMAQDRALNVHAVSPVTDKVARAMPVTGVMEQGRIWFPGGRDWLRDLELELFAFPEGEHDDFVDNLSYAVADLRERAVPIIATESVDERESWTRM